MPQYDLHVRCPDCGNFHDALDRVTLGESFEVRRVGDVYDGNLPLEFYQAIAQIHCPSTDKPVKQQEPDMMVLSRCSWKVVKWGKRSDQSNQRSDYFTARGMGRFTTSGLCKYK